jgi:hypothetical protein
MWNQSGTWRARRRIRAVESACAVVIFLSVSACGSNAGNADDSAGTGGSGTASGGGSSGGSGNTSSSSDKVPDCGAKALSATRLPGKNVYQPRVAGGNVYYGEDAGINRVPLGNQTNGGQTQLSTGAGLYLNDTQFGTFERVTYPAGNLRLFPLAGGDAITQPSQNESVIGDWRYPGHTQTLFGLTSYRPVAYLRHDVGTGAEQVFTTSLNGVSEYETTLLQGPTGLFLGVSGDQDTDPSTLYRIDKNGGDPVAMTTNIPVRFDLYGVDASYVYLAVDGGAGTEMYGPAIWQVPVDGSGPAVRSPIKIYHTITTSVFATDAGTFLHFYDAFQVQGYATYRLGPAKPEAAAPVPVFGSLFCELHWLWSTGSSMYGLVEEDDYSAWLLELPSP